MTPAAPTPAPVSSTRPRTTRTPADDAPVSPSTVSTAVPGPTAVAAVPVGAMAGDPSDPATTAAQAPAYRARLRTDRAPARPRNAFTATARAAARLTPRDRWILAMLAEHRILTTTQLARLAFGTRRVAALRLATLHTLGVVHRFRPYTPLGSAPWHWLLAPTGAHLVADDHDTTVDALGYHPERLARLAVSLHLAHTVGVNDLLTDLAHHCRTHPEDGHLAVWWSERRCHHAWGGRIRPDAYARWHTPHPPGAGHGDAGTEVDWFLEYDTGTENLDRIINKLTAYARLTADTGITTPVLFRLHGPRRETGLHHLIRAWQTTHPHHAFLPVATTHPHLPDHPAGPVWAPVRPFRTPDRIRLTDLAAAFPDTASAHAATTTDRPAPGTDTAADAPVPSGPDGTWPAPHPVLHPAPGLPTPPHRLDR
jgi:hypothetical protein